MEVRSKLYELYCTTQLANEFMAMLIEMDLLNEERYARSFARGKFRMQHWGKEKIKVMLRQKQVSDYCIKKALTEIDGDEYAATLNKLASKKYESIKSDRSMASKKAKLYSYLVQKGYERDLVMDAIKGVMSYEL